MKLLFHKESVPMEIQETLLSFLDPTHDTALQSTLYQEVQVRV